MRIPRMVVRSDATMCECSASRLLTSFLSRSVSLDAATSSFCARLS